MGEHARIATYFAPLSLHEAGSFNLTDDAAVLTPPAGKALVITTDSVIERVHVLAGASAAQFAQKLVRRNLSDLAAMGALPWRYLLNLHTPATLAETWFADFAATLEREQQHFGMVLAGGDSTSGDDGIRATLTAIGLLEGDALRRNGAQAGDDIYVSGTVGDAALGLAQLQQGMKDSPLIARYHLPQPRLALGQALHGIASAAIDLSDGLVQDVAQLARASQLAARITREAIPLSDAARAMLDWDAILAGGDDYELCFTAPPSQRATLQTISARLGVPVTLIGSMAEGEGVCVVDANGRNVTPRRGGFEHV